VLLAIAGLLGSKARGAITFHQLDDFQGGTTMNWGQGVNATIPTAWMGSGGPTGPGDGFIENTSTGTFGGSSKQIMSIRISLRGTTSAAFSTTTPFDLPADLTWHHAVFDLDAAHMSVVPFTGSGTIDDTLANVFEMRILSAAGGPSITGDPIQSTLDVDNILATQVPEPVTGLTAVTVGAGGFLLHGGKLARRPPSA
jgi:hypothetical protein